MHDLTLANEILDIALREAKQRKISRIKIGLVEEGHVTGETLKEAFKLVSQGTKAQGASLEINPLVLSLAKDGEIPETKVLEIEVEE